MFVQLGRLLIVLCVGLSAAKADPAPASRWAADVYSAIRLVDLGGREDRLLVVEMSLKPGFKTYWRYPGDSGVPPVFNWAGSDNLASVQILWPAPVRFSDASGQSIGYHDSVRFLAWVTPVDPARPVVARLALDYAVCEKLCLPARGAVDITSPASQRHGQAAAALKTIPVETLDGFDIVMAENRSGGDKPFVIVDVVVPPGFQGGQDLFAEGPTDDWALPLPVRISQSSDRVRYKVLMDGVPKRQSWRGATLTLTLVTPVGALEKKLTTPQ